MKIFCDLGVYILIAVLAFLLNNSAAQAQGYISVSGAPGENAWLNSVVENQYSDGLTNFLLRNTKCTLSLSSLVSIIRLIAGNSWMSPTQKISIAVVEMSELLNPPSGPASCGESAICLCELFRVMFPGSICNVKSGKGSDGKGHAFAEFWLPLTVYPGLPGYFAIDALNGIINYY